MISRIVQPGLPDQVSYAAEAPPTSDAVIPGYAYPADGSIVRIGSANEHVVAQPGESSSAQAGVGALAVSLFGGEVTRRVARHPRERRGGLGERVGQRLRLDDHRPHRARPADHAGREPRRPARGLGQRSRCSAPRSRPSQKPPRSATATVTAIRVKLIADHGGLAAGSMIEIGSAGAVGDRGSPAVARPPTAAKPTTKTTTPAPPPVIPADAPREPGTSIPGGAPPELVRPAPGGDGAALDRRLRLPGLRPGVVRRHLRRAARRRLRRLAPRRGHLRAARDAAPRGRGRHRVLGRVERHRRLAPLAARPGRERVLLRPPLRLLAARRQRPAREGRRRARASWARRATPSSRPSTSTSRSTRCRCCYRGYDGAVAPYPFLNAWRRAQDVSFDAGRAYLPLDGPAAGPPTGVAPPAAAVLLEADDISSTSGLVPGSLESTLSGRAPKSPTGGQDR